MKALSVYTFGDLSYGIWEEGDPFTLEARDIHWLASTHPCVAGITVRDEHTVSLLDLPACLGLDPVAGKFGSYLLLEIPEHVRSASMAFILPATAGREILDAQEVFALPQCLASPVMKTYTVHNSRPIAVIDTAELFHRVQSANFVPPRSQCRAAGLEPLETSPSGAYHLVASADQTFALPDFQTGSVAPAEAQIHPFEPVPDYVAGIGLKDGEPLPVIDLAKRLNLKSTGSSGPLLDIDLNGLKIRLRTDACPAEMKAADAAVKPLPPLVRKPWCNLAVIGNGGIFPLLDVAGLLSDPGDSVEGSGGYRTTSDFLSRFKHEDIEIVEFELGFGRHALPAGEVEAPIAMRPIHPLAGAKPLVAGVVEHETEILPVIDLVRCFGHCSRPTDEWQLIPLANGDFKALILTEAAYPGRLLPVDSHRELPFENADALVYGCYPDDVRVRLIFNAYAMAVHFDRIRHVDFFQALANVARRPSKTHKDRESALSLLTPNVEGCGLPEKEDRKVRQPFEAALQEEVTNLPTAPPVGVASPQTEDSDADPHEPATVDAAAAAAESDSVASGTGGLDRETPADALLLPQDQPLPESATAVQSSDEDFAGAVDGETVAAATADEFAPEAVADSDLSVSHRCRALQPTPPAASFEDTGADGMPAETEAAPEAPPIPGKKRRDLRPDADDRATLESETHAAGTVATASAGSAFKETDIRPDEEDPGIRSTAERDVSATDCEDAVPEPESVVGEDDAAGAEDIFSIEFIPAIPWGGAGTPIEDLWSQRSFPEDPVVGAEGSPVPDATEAGGDDEARCRPHSPTVAENVPWDPEAPSEAAADGKDAGDSDLLKPWEAIPSIPEENVEDIRDDDDFAQEASRPESKDAAVSGNPRRKAVWTVSAAVILALLLSSGWLDMPELRQKVQGLRNKISQHFSRSVTSVETVIQTPAPKSGPPSAVEANEEEIGFDTARPFEADPLLEPGQIKIVDQHGRIVIYRVKRGDTLWGISKRYTGSGFNYPKLAEDNEIQNPDLIFPKQRIEVK